jgi:hypothetical protein
VLIRTPQIMFAQLNIEIDTELIQLKNNSIAFDEIVFGDP